MYVKSIPHPGESHDYPPQLPHSDRRRDRPAHPDRQEDDSKAYPGETAITEKLARFGAKVARGEWNAQWTAAEFAEAFAKMDVEHANINFVTFSKGNVFKTETDANAGGASGHTATWKYAYNIAPIRAWIFRQKKA